MALIISPVRSESDLEHFLTFSWAIYQGDPYWVPPLLDDRRNRLDPARSPFWQNAARELWLVCEDG